MKNNLMDEQPMQKLFITTSIVLVGRRTMRIFFNLLFLSFLIVPKSIAMEKTGIGDLSTTIAAEEEPDADLHFYISTGDTKMINENIDRIFHNKKNIYWSERAKKSGFEGISDALSSKRRWSFLFFWRLLELEARNIREIKKNLFEGAYEGNPDKIADALKAARKKHIDGTAIINHLGQTAVQVAEENGRKLTALYIRSFKQTKKLENMSKKFPSSEELFEEIGKKAQGTFLRAQTQHRRSIGPERKLKYSPKINRKKNRSPSPSMDNLIFSNKSPSRDTIILLNKSSSREEIVEDLITNDREMFARKRSGKNFSKIANLTKLSPKKKNRSVSPSPEHFLVQKPPSRAEILEENLKVNMEMVIWSFKNNNFSKITENVLSHDVFLRLIEKNKFNYFKDSMLGFLMEQHENYGHWNLDMWVLLNIMQLTKTIDAIDRKLVKLNKSSNNYRRAWFEFLVPKDSKDKEPLLDPSEKAAQLWLKMGQKAPALAIREPRYMLLFDKTKILTAACQIAFREGMGLH